tara:strand:- start:5804 stop:6721 length:918 start_codon:yes stop_codon:yes gene_type:complete
VLSQRFDLFDIPNTQKIHKIKTPNLGGLALIPYVIYISYNFELVEEIQNTFYLFIIVVLIGLIDDIKNIKPYYKLLALLIPILIFTKNIAEVNSLGNYNSFNLNLGSYSFIFTILCIFLLTNAFNYIDGIDGLLAINIIISLVFFLFLNFNEHNLFLCFIIFLIIYLLFNFNILKIFPKLFIGDSGSLGFGFLISSFLIIFTQENYSLHPSVVIWFVAFVVYEFLSINIIRIKLKKNIFKRDLNFIFNLLGKNYSNKKSLFICSILHFCLCSISLFIYYFEIYLFSLILFFILFFVYLVFRFKQI